MRLRKLLEAFDLTIFPIHQRIIIGSLLEEIEWLKERVASLEKDRDEVNRLWDPAYTLEEKE